MLEAKGLYNKKHVPKAEKDAEAKDENYEWVFDYGWNEKWDRIRDPWANAGYNERTEELSAQLRKKELMDKIMGGHNYD